MQAKVLSALIAALEDRDGDVRAQAAQMLDNLGVTGLIQPLLGALGKTPIYGVDSCEAMCDQLNSIATGQALKRIGDVRALDPLIAGLQYSTRGRELLASDVRRQGFWARSATRGQSTHSSS